jgi:hypothetical protein
MQGHSQPEKMKPLIYPNFQQILQNESLFPNSRQPKFVMMCEELTYREAHSNLEATIFIKQISAGLCAVLMKIGSTHTSLG